MSLIDIIEKAVASLKVETLLQPLDKLHEEKLKKPLAALKPSTLLKPVSDGFQSLLGPLDGLSGEALVGPLTKQLDKLKSTVTGLDVTGPIDDLLAAIEKVKKDLSEIKPSQLLDGFDEAFTNLEKELDRFKPSVVFAPVAELATPLLGFLENIQAETITALFKLFEEPLKVLDRLKPDVLVGELQGKLDAVTGLLQTVDPPTRFNQLKGKYFDLKGAVSAGGVQAKIELTAMVDPELQIGEVIAAYNELVTGIARIKQTLGLPGMADLYEQVRKRLLDLLPPYARALLDPETFKRVMRLADPTRFLAELDKRFDEIKNRLIPIRPKDLGAELDTTYTAVLGLVSQLDLSDSLNKIKDIVNQLKGVVDSIRVDFVAADIDKAIGQFRAVVEGLDPARLFAGLDGIHTDLVGVLDQTLPSKVLAGLQVPLDQVKQILTNLDPRQKLEKPIEDAWASVKAALDQVDFTVVLKPLIDKLDELEAEFVLVLKKVESAFDEMLGAGKAALGGGGGVSASVSVSVGGSF